MDINITKLAQDHQFPIFLKSGILVHKLEYLSTLPSNSIFVFGSNLAGRHGAGAAISAYLKFGAELGNGEGLQGQSYALPTLGHNLEQLDSTILYEHFKKFIIFARDNKQYTFILTKIGCGLAGYKNAENMFINILDDVIHELDLSFLPVNVIYPSVFIE